MPHGERDALPKLRGMFAFAIWDKAGAQTVRRPGSAGRKAFLPRANRIPVRLCVGDEILACVLPACERKLNYAALDDYLTYLYVPPPQTIFQGIYELPPAHWLEWQDGQLRTGQYWDVDFTGEKDTSKRSSGKRKKSSEDTVAARLISDVPLGIFLSGGMDSSTVATLMAKHLAEPVRAFTLKFQEGGRWYSETEFAREISEAIGAKSRELEIVSKSAELLGTVTRHFDEPFGNPTSLLLYQLSEAARQHVTVASGR